MNTKNKIKKLLSLTILVMALVSFTAGAAEIIYEPFDYTAETDLTGSGGTGFDGAWSTTSKDENPVFSVKDGGQSFATPDIGGANALDVAGNSAYRAADAHRAEANRAISAASQTALLTDGSTIWFSVLYVNDNSSVSAFVIGTDVFNPVETWLLSSYPDTGEGFGFGTEDGSTIKAIAFDGTATPIIDDSGVTATSAKLIVGKITWAAAGTSDTLTLYDVTDVTTEPTTPIATVSADLDQSTFDLLALQHNGATAVFDEIRFGATYADVSPYTFVIDAVAPTMTTLSPADDSTNMMVDKDNLEITFSELIAIGTGNITIKNLTNAAQTVIDVTDAEQVSISGKVLMIDPTVGLDPSKDYAIQIDAGAIVDLASNAYAGIANDTTWNFTTSAAKLLVYEPFDYTDGSQVNGTPVNEGTGLTGAYSAITGDNGKVPPQYYGRFDGGMSYGDLKNVGRGFTGSANQDPWFQVSIDPAVMVDKLDDGDELWFTAMVSNGNNSPWDDLCSVGGMEFGVGFRFSQGERFGVFNVDPMNYPLDFQAAMWINGIEFLGADMFSVPLNWVYNETQVKWEVPGKTRAVVAHIELGEIDTVTLYVPGEDLVCSTKRSIVTGAIDNSLLNKLRLEAGNGNTMGTDRWMIGETPEDIGFTLVPDETAPTLDAISTEQVEPVPVGTPVEYVLTFSENPDITTFDASDFVNLGSADITIGEVSKHRLNFVDYPDFQNADGVFVVEIIPTSQGTLQLQVASNAEFADLSGNVTTATLPLDDTSVITAYNSVDAGVDMVTWDDQVVKLTASNVNSSDVKWTVTDPNIAGVTFTIDPVDPVDPSSSLVVSPDIKVDISSSTAPRPIVIEVTLTTSGVLDPTPIDTMKIYVYDDACAAAIGNGAFFDPGDVDKDCDTDIDDLRAMAIAWLDNHEMTAPAEKP